MKTFKMSFRDTRNFIEMLRALGYPNLISLESFRNPNFPLVANLIVWLTKRFDPDFDLTFNEIDNNEDDRIRLIRNAAEFMALKANVKLNTKRLYQADGYAIKELLKITTLLYDALNVNIDEGDDEIESNLLRNIDISDKIGELKLSRQLASEITQSGANIFDMLGKEIEWKSQRQKSLSKTIEINDIELGIKEAINNLNKEIEETKQLIDNIANNETNLDTKIERRKIEIDRYEKRLQSLNKVRPAFLEEFQALENELETLFIQYSTRLRLLNMLEKQFNDNERQQIEMEINNAIPKIDIIPLDDEVEDFLDNPSKQHQERPRASTGGRSKLKAYGAMQPPLSVSPSLSSDESDDDLFLDKDEPELVHSDDESLVFELEGAANGKGRMGSKDNNNDSDDDF